MKQFFYHTAVILLKIDTKVYRSADSMTIYTESYYALPIEFIKSLDMAGLPTHKLIVQIGIYIILVL
jgi:hypothetical protein